MVFCAKREIEISANELVICMFISLYTTCRRYETRNKKNRKRKLQINKYLSIRKLERRGVDFCLFKSVFVRRTKQRNLSRLYDHVARNRRNVSDHRRVKIDERNDKIARSRVARYRLKFHIWVSRGTEGRTPILICIRRYICNGRAGYARIVHAFA